MHRPDGRHAGADEGWWQMVAGVNAYVFMFISSKSKGIGPEA